MPLRIDGIHRVPRSPSRHTTNSHRDGHLWGQLSWSAPRGSIIWVAAFRLGAACGSSITTP